METKKIGFEGQNYVAPRAESVEIVQESILCSSRLDGFTESIDVIYMGSWDEEDKGGSWDGETLLIP